MRNAQPSPCLASRLTLSLGRYPLYFHLVGVNQSLIRITEPFPFASPSVWAGTLFTSTWLE